MELLPIGPVVIIDTAGIDDVGELGQQRIEKSKKIIERTDIAILVCDYEGWSQPDENLAKEFQNKNIPVISVINKIDLKDIDNTNFEKIKNNSNAVIKISAKNDTDIISKIKEALIRTVPENFINPPSILEGLVSPEDLVILVTPIDKEAPKGRLIMPQVNVLRELLDNNCISIVVTEKNLQKALNTTKNEPKIVITDSQAFKQVSEIIPNNISLTSFSILFARLKGDLNEFINGAKQIDKLKNGDKVLICESCTHHAIEDDIGKVKIPKLIKQKTGKEIIFEHVSSHDFPKNINDYALIIHCGGCMTNRREILSRISKSKEKNVPITNYGIAISYCIGILERATKVFLKNC